MATRAIQAGSNMISTKSMTRRETTTADPTTRQAVTVPRHLDGPGELTEAPGPGLPDPGHALLNQNAS
jgi:hypothetical protein